MTQKILLIFSVILITVTVNAQQIQAEKVFGGYQFTLDGKALSLKEMKNIIEPDTEAYQLIKSAKSNNDLASIMGGVGGFMIGWPLGTAIGGGDPEWIMAGIGAGLVIVSFPLSSAASKKAFKAMEKYNTGLSSTGNYFKPEFNLNINGDGIGVVMQF